MASKGPIYSFQGTYCAQQALRRIFDRCSFIDGSSAVVSDILITVHVTAERNEKQIEANEGRLQLTMRLIFSWKDNGNSSSQRFLHRYAT